MSRELDRAKRRAGPVSQKMVESSPPPISLLFPLSPCRPCNHSLYVWAVTCIHCSCKHSCYAHYNPATSSLTFCLRISLCPWKSSASYLKPQSFFFFKHFLCISKSCFLHDVKTASSAPKFDSLQPPLQISQLFPAPYSSWSLQRWPSQKQSQLSDKPKLKKIFLMLSH